MANGRNDVDAIIYATANGRLCRLYLKGSTICSVEKGIVEEHGF